MIHSLAGGVIKGGGAHRIIKAATSVGERWYLSDEFAVSVSDKVIVEAGEKIETAVVTEVKMVDESASPIRIKSAYSVINVVFEE